MTDSEVCKINIATSKNGQQHGNIIIFRTVRAESSGPCLQNTVIKRGDVNEECPEEEITTGPQGINLTLQLGKQSQPIFSLLFTGGLFNLISKNPLMNLQLVQLSENISSVELSIINHPAILQKIVSSNAREDIAPDECK